MAEPIIVLPLEDWSGITDQKERRRRQNRLNQRTRRQRHRDPKEGSSRPATLQRPQLTTVSARLADFECLSGLHILGSDSEASKQTIHQLEILAFAEYARGHPRPEFLLGLTQLNFLRALFSNIDVLGLSASDMHDDSISPFCTANSWHAEHSENSLPEGLKPTNVQRSNLHHPWIDLLPSSKMRDNLILAGDTFDDIDLCHDLCGYRASSRNENHSGVIVWKDPWDSSGWEVTEAFMRKWGWAIRDCKDLFQSTNHWRAKRGEKPLFSRKCIEVIE